MANLDDVVTVQKNGVVGLNALTKTLDDFRAIYKSVVGSKTYLGAVDNSLVSTNSGRLVNVTICISGANISTLHDAGAVSGASNSNIIASFAASQAVGTYAINVPFSNGLVVKPGSGTTLSITYAED